jgi:hypothetical protein
MAEMRTAYKNSSKNAKGRSIERPKRGMGHNSKINLKEICEDVDWIHVAQE